MAPSGYDLAPYVYSGDADSLARYYDHLLSKDDPMSICTHARCNNCEKVVWPGEDREGFGEDELLRLGWVEVRRYESLIELEGIDLDEEDPPDPDSLDFCSARCLAVWSAAFTGMKEFRAV